MEFELRPYTYVTLFPGGPLKSLIAIALLAASVTVNAASYTITTEDHSSKNYTAKIAYPVLQHGVVPASGIITTLIRTHLLDSGCGAEDAAESETGYDYDARAGVVALNPVYVGYEVAASSYCGGAHPNHGTYNVTYDSVTGAPVDLEVEIPLQNVEKTSRKSRAAYLKQLARIVYDAMIANPRLDVGECYKGRARTEVLEELESFYPEISGLARNKQVVIRTNPPHVATPCALAVRVPYAKVSTFIKPASKLHSWLR